MGWCVFRIPAAHICSHLFWVCVINMMRVSSMHALFSWPSLLFAALLLPCIVLKSKKQDRPGNEARILCHDIGYYGPEIKNGHILVLSVQR